MLKKEFIEVWCPYGVLFKLVPRIQHGLLRFGIQAVPGYDTVPNAGSAKYGVTS